MKLLGWLHQKLQQKSPETFKDFTNGKPLLGDQDYPTKPSFSFSYCPGSFKQLERVEDNFGEETSLVVSESFHGFLSIGTLGAEPIINEPETPTFATPLENTTEIKTEVTENDLMLIHYELEKFLDAEAKEEEFDESSGRNSPVSTITLSDKQIEDVNAEDYEKFVVCPLQGYLFGSTIELPETKIDQKKEKASLAELFQRTKIVDECPKDEEVQKKQARKPSMHLMKKMIKKLNVSSKSLSHSAGGFSATKNKLQKVLRIFHRKIHPESSAAKEEYDNPQGNKKEDIMHNCYCGSMHPDEDNRSRGSSNNLNLPRCKFNGSITSKNREHWIKTDADYLVLEL